MAMNIGDIKLALMIVRVLLFLASYKWIELKIRIFLEKPIGSESSKSI